MGTRNQEKRKRRMMSAKKVLASNARTGVSCLAIPQGFELLEVDDNAEREWDFLPYEIRTKGQNIQAEDDDGVLEEGDLAWVKRYGVHNNVGPDDLKAICPKKTRGQPCPICEAGSEERKTIKSDPELRRMSKEEWGRRMSPFRAQDRQIFVVRPKTGPNKGKIMLFDVAYGNFGEYLDAKLEASPKYERFATLDNGMTATISPKKETFNGRDFWTFPGISFADRKPIDESILEKIPDLDAIPQQLSYKKLKQLFFQISDQEEEEGTNHKAKAATAEKVHDEDDNEDDSDLEGDDDAKLEKGMTVDHDEYGECTVVKISEDGKKVTLKDSDGDLHKGVSVADVSLMEEEDEEEEEEERPTTGSSTNHSSQKKNTGKDRGQSSQKTDEEDEDEDDSDLEDEDDEEEEDED